MREQRPQAQQDDGVPLHPGGVRADRQHGRLERHEQAGLHHGEADRDPEITVRPSSRTQRALRDSMKGLAERLLAVCDADELDGDLQKQLALVMEVFNGFGEAPPPGRRAKREKGPSDDLFGMPRC